MKKTVTLVFSRFFCWPRWLKIACHTHKIRISKAFLALLKEAVTLDVTHSCIPYPEVN